MSTSCACETSPGTHTFFPSLPQMIPCSYWTLTYAGVLSSSGALYMISVRQARVLPPSFFRFCLTTDTLDLGYILPTAGRIWDFHPLERALTGRTNKRRRKIPPASIVSYYFCSRERFSTAILILRETPSIFIYFATEDALRLGFIARPTAAYVPNIA